MDTNEQRPDVDDDVSGEKKHKCTSVTYSYTTINMNNRVDCHVSFFTHSLLLVPFLVLLIRNVLALTSTMDRTGNHSEGQRQ